VTRNHGFMVYDSLYGLDAADQPPPQMVAGDATTLDALTWRLTLRDGLVFHDGQPMLARETPWQACAGGADATASGRH